MFVVTTVLDIQRRDPCGPVLFCNSLHVTQHIDLLSVFHSINSIRVSGSWFLSWCMWRRGQVRVAPTAGCVLNS